MTREEAIENLKELIDTYITCHGEEDTVAVSLDNVDVEAFDMAIKALEQETVSKESYDHEYFLRKELEIKITKIEQQKPKWIPVSEGLPKIADVYRVTRYYPNNIMNPNYIVDACFFDGSNTWYNDNRINHERAYANNVIAWQENPEPYKSESEDDNEMSVSDKNNS